MDISDVDRNNENYGDGDGPYFFSYSLNGYGLDDNSVNFGMATVVDTSSGSPVVYPFKEGAVRNPAGKIMLAEEPGSGDTSDSPNGSIINDGRWGPECRSPDSPA